TRVLHAPVVAGNDSEVVVADPVFGAPALALEPEDRRGQIDVAVGRENVAEPAQLADGVLEIHRVRGRMARPRLAETDGIGDEAARAPAVRLEVVRDAREDVVPVAPQIPPSVAVAVDGIGAEARRDGLPRAHRARVRAELLEETEALVAAEEQERLELGREEARAGRIRERERGERIEHAIVAHAGAEIGLDAEDRDEHLRRDAEPLARRI